MRYIFKRLLIFIPTFLAVTMIAFFMRQLAPGDPIDFAVQGGYQSEYTTTAKQYRQDYILKAQEMKMDSPTFYFSILSAAHPSGYQRIIFPEEKKQADAEMALNNASWKYFIPSFRWNGLKNQYHQWLKNVLKLDFGKS